MALTILHDDAGRVIRTIENYVDGDPSTGSSDEDVTVATTYTAAGQLATLTAVNPNTGDQVTHYVYGTAVGGGTPAVYRNDVLRAVIYPDSDDTSSLGNGPDGIYDRVEYTYNRQAEVVSLKDQNETLHEYAFDGLGRQVADIVTLPQGSDIDDAVLRIERSYEVRGMVASLTSYDAPSGGSPVNQIVRQYNDFGQLVKEYQEHAGEVGANTLYVEYAYAGASSRLRLQSIRYPNGRLIHYTYGTANSTADVLGRLDAIRDDTGGNPGDVLAGYTYLGLGTVVREDYPEPQVRLDLWGGTSGTYAGFDRFGRIVDHLWRNYGASTDADRIQHGYDRASNRLWRANPVAAAQNPAVHLDELYAYDGAYRLINAERGELNANKDGILSKTFAQDWGLDATSNWATFKDDQDGAGWDLQQTRQHNEANEVTSASSWATPAHDRAGNMTTVPKPPSPANGLSLTWDAWNRLVEVTDGEVTVGRFRYDGEGRRIVKQFDSDSPADPDGLDVYEHIFLSGQQVIETRAGAGDTPAPAHTLQPKYQFVWKLLCG